MAGEIPFAIDVRKGGFIATDYQPDKKMGETYGRDC
jgi:hypothetical protein